MLRHIPRKFWRGSTAWPTVIKSESNTTSLPSGELLQRRPVYKFYWMILCLKEEKNKWRSEGLCQVNILPPIGGERVGGSSLHPLPRHLRRLDAYTFRWRHYKEPEVTNIPDYRRDMLPLQGLNHWNFFLIFTYIYLNFTEVLVFIHNAHMHSCVVRFLLFFSF